MNSHQLPDQNSNHAALRARLRARRLDLYNRRLGHACDCNNCTRRLDLHNRYFNRACNCNKCARYAGGNYACGDYACANCDAHCDGSISSVDDRACCPNCNQHIVADHFTNHRFDASADAIYVNHDGSIIVDAYLRDGYDRDWNDE